MLRSLCRCLGIVANNEVSRKSNRYCKWVALSIDALEGRIAPSAVPFAGATYTQYFNSLMSNGDSQSWTNDSTIPAWSLFNKTPSAITTIKVDNGGNNTRSFYSFGNEGDSDRALGAIGGSDLYFGSPAEGAVAGWIAVALQNKTAATITSINLTYDGEQWRNAGNPTLQTMVLEYGFGNSFAAVSTWTQPGSAFNFTSPEATESVTFGNGNVTGLVAGRGGSISAGFNWAVDAILWIRWVERNDVALDHGLAIDNFTFSVPTSTPATPTTTTVSAGSSVYGATTLQAIVSPNPGDGNGTISFFDNGVAIPGGANVALVGGVATLAVSTLNVLAVGTHPISAVYSGGAGYALSTSPSVAKDVTPALITITGLSAQNKPYDGTLTATVNGTPALALPAGDIYSADATNNRIQLVNTSRTYRFDSADIGSNKSILIDPSFSLSGSAAGNYTLTQPMLMAAIAPVDYGDAPDRIPGGDQDGDGVLDPVDNSPYVFNNNQFDTDADGFGDVSDPAPLDSFIRGNAYNYPTLNNDNGARHIIAGPRLGAAVDWESNGVPSLTATGDGPDDDGITFGSLIASPAANTTGAVTANLQNAATAKLDGWLDFNQDGDWNDNGEQIFASRALSAGNNPLSFTIPAGAKPGNSCARFRVSSAGGLGTTGLANDGEVEDYAVVIAQVPIDYGDAPDRILGGDQDDDRVPDLDDNSPYIANQNQLDTDSDGFGDVSDPNPSNATIRGNAYNYPTLDVHMSGQHGEIHLGARHVIAGPRLGASVDGDVDGQPSLNAAGDGADDDGVTFLSLPASLTDSTTGAVTVNLQNATNGFLDAWIDFNQDGDWNDNSEQIFNRQSLSAGDNALAFSVPAGAKSGSTYARFRVSSAGGLATTGLANDGEVEDYQVVFIPLGTTTTTVTASSNPSTFGSSATFTAKVTNAVTSSAPTGSVSFIIDSVPYSGAVVDVGIAGNSHSWSITLATLAAGTHAIEATFRPTGVFSDSSATLAGGQAVNKAHATIAITPYSVTYDGAAHTAAGAATGALGENLGAALNLTGTMHTAAGTYAADAWSFHHVSGNYFDESGTVSNSIAKAHAAINIIPYSVTYDGLTHAASGTAIGVLGENLASGFNFTGATHTNAGVYPADMWTFHHASGNYFDDSGMVSNVISKARATITITPYNVTFDGLAHTASGTAVGVAGENLTSGFNFVGTAHTSAGAYPADAWTFQHASGNYFDEHGTVSDTISKARATINITPYSGTFDGLAHTATGTATGALGENLVSGLNLTGTSHTNAGVFPADAWTFHHASGNYFDENGAVSDAINKARATINIIPYSITFDGLTHTAIGTATGALGQNLSSGLNLAGTTHTSAATYANDVWTFHHDLGNYFDESGTISDSIGKAHATVNIVPYSATYDGLAHTATGSATGAAGENLGSGLNLALSSHTNAGVYPADAWTFHHASGNYFDESGTIGDSIGKAHATINVTPYSVTYDGVSHSATGTATGAAGENLTSGLNLTGTSHTNAGAYPADAWTFHHTSGNYFDKSGTVSDAIAKVHATINIARYSITFDGLAHIATGTAIGVVGENLGPGLNLTGTSHTNAGVYSADTWSFHHASGNYFDESGGVDNTIAKARAQINVVPYSVTFDGMAHLATGTATGVLGESLAIGISLSGTSHTNAGSYAADPWTFHHVSGNYFDESGAVNNTIGKASTTIQIGSIVVTYDGATHAASATWTSTGVDAATATLPVTYTGKNGTVYGPSTTAPTAAGEYSATATFAGDANHTGSSGSANVTINRKLIEVAADPKSKLFGVSDPLLTYRVTSGSLATGDSFAGVLSRTPGEALGVYPILQGNLSLSTNYTLTYIGANLAIVPNPMISIAAVPNGSILEITDTAGNANAFSVTLSGANLVIADTSFQFLATPDGWVLGPGGKSISRPLATFTGSIKFDGALGNDSLTIDYTNGYFALPITFIGGEQTGSPGDQLTIAGGAFAKITSQATNGHDGSVLLEPTGSAANTTISYTGLEPLLLKANVVSDLEINLPAAASDAILEDDGIDNVLSQLRSSNPVPTFETLTFINPTNSLTIQTGNIGDMITVRDLPDFDGSLTLGTMANPFRAITFAGAVALAGGHSLAAEALATITLPLPTSNLSTSGALSLAADNMSFLGGTIGAGVVTLRPQSNAVPIDLGGADIATSPVTLGLTNAELNRISANTLKIGHAASGTLTVKADITRSTSTAMELTSGGDVIMSGGQVNTGGGDLSIRPGTTSAVRPTKTGLDATASSVALAGDLAISFASAATYDRLDVAGNLNLNGVHLICGGAYSPSFGDVFTIVSATNGSISNTFANLPEDSLVTLNGAHLQIHYTSTTVTLTSLTNTCVDGAGNLVVDVGNGRSDNIIVTVNGPNYRISDSNSGNVFFTAIAGATGTGTNSVTIPISAVTGAQFFIKTNDQNDTLNIDFTGGNFSDAIVYDGGPQTGADALVLTSLGPVTQVKHTLASATGGKVDVAGNSQITYTSAESIIDQLNAADRIFNFIGAAETVAVSDSGGADGRSTIDSTLGQPIAFPNPANSLTVDMTSGAAAGADTVTIASLDAVYRASLAINTDGGDTVNLNAALVLGSATSDGDFTVSNASKINLGANISTDAGSMSGGGDVVLTGSVDLTANVSIDSDRATGVDGNITFNSLANADAAASNRTVSLAAGGGNVALQNVGLSRNVQALTVVSANNVSLGSIESRSGGISVSAAGAITLKGDLITDGLATTGPISLSGNVILAGNITMDADRTSDAAILISGTIDADNALAQDRALTILSGTAATTLGGALGLMQPLAGLDVTSAAIDIIGATCRVNDGAVGGTVTLAGPANTAINLGGASSPGTLGLTDAELDRIVAGNLIIGNSNSGAITISADITRPSSTALQVSSAGDITIAGGRIDTGGGPLSLRPGPAPKAVKPTKSGVDATVSTLSLPGELSVDIAGPAADVQYARLNVSGSVNLVGASLAVNLGYTPAPGQQFTIIENDGNPDPVLGTFTGKPEGSTFTVGAQSLQISYAGGDGNDVVLIALPTAPTPTVSATLDGAGNLLIADIGGVDNAFRISAVGGTLVIEERNQQFVSAPSGWFLSPQRKSISRPLATFSGRIVVDGGANTAVGDTLALVGDGNISTARYTPSGVTSGSGSVVLSDASASFTVPIDFTRFEPVDIGGMFAATIASPVNPINALVLNAGFDAETGTTHPAIVVSGSTDIASKAIEAAHLFNNTNVIIDTSATAGMGSNSIAVNSTIALGHNNANLTLRTNPWGNVSVNANLAVAGALTVAAGTANLNADLLGGNVTGSSTTINVAPSAPIQDGIDIAASGGTLVLAPANYAGNVPLTKPLTLSVATGTATLGGVVSGAFGFTKSGNGALALTGVNTYLGNTNLTRGRLQISNDNQLGSAAATVTATTPGLLEITGDMTTSRGITLNNSALLQVDAGKTLTLSGARVDGGFLIGPGTIATTGSNPSVFSGARTTSSLTLSANADASFNSFVNGGILNLTAAKTFALNSFTNTSSGQMFVQGTANVTDFASNGQIDVAGTGAIVNVGSSGLAFGSGSMTIVNRTGALDNIGDGMILLGGSDARLTGGLLINHGIIRSRVPGVDLIVESGGMAKGTGLYGSVLTQNGGRFSPGSSPGTAFTSQFNVSGGGTFLFEIADATGTAGARAGWDRVRVEPSLFASSPRLNFTATPTDTFIIQIVSLLNSGDYNTPGLADHFDPHRSYSWPWIDASHQGVTVAGTFNPSMFHIDATGFANPLRGRFAVVSQDGGRTSSIVYTPTLRSEHRVFFDLSGDSALEFDDRLALRKRLKESTIQSAQKPART